MQKRKRPELKIIGHYMMVNGEKIAIDPLKTNLPDRCKLAIAEMATGKKYELVGDS